MKILSYEECKKELSEILTDGPNDIKLEVEDIDTVTKNKDLLVMSVSEYSGSHAAKKAIQFTVLDFEENGLSLKESDGIIVSYKMNTNYQIMELAGAMEVIHDKLIEIYTDDEPSVIWGISCDNNMKEDCIKASVVISYSKQRRCTYANNYITGSLV